jgi:hypothetical protein
MAAGMSDQSSSAVATDFGALEMRIAPSRVIDLRDFGFRLLA